MGVDVPKPRLLDLFCGAGGAGMGYPDQECDGIVCPRCFAELAEAKGARGPWRLAPQAWPQGVSSVHVDGRVWDTTSELWADHSTIAEDIEQAAARAARDAYSRGTRVDNATINTGTAPIWRAVARAVLTAAGGADPREGRDRSGGER